MAAKRKEIDDHQSETPSMEQMRMHAPDAAGLMKALGNGLVETRRESQTIFYSLAAGPAEQVIHLLHDIYCAVPGSGGEQAQQK
jgi:DNA-binding transcriptional ArsR family regulator